MDHLEEVLINTRPVFVWLYGLYGEPPTPLARGTVLSHSNYRPVRVDRYLKASFSETGDSPNHLLLAQVSWFYPSCYRFVFGKPAELWCDDLFESFGVHSFVPLNAKNLICRCACGPLKYERESLLAVVPLVE